MGFPRTTPYSNGKLTTAVATNSSDGSRAMANGISAQNDYTKQLIALQREQVRIENDLADLRNWKITEMTRATTLESQKAVGKEYSQRKAPLSAELRKITNKQREYKDMRHKLGVSTDGARVLLLERIDAKLDAILRDLGIDWTQT